MNIKETFLKLTSHTYPHGSESELDHLLIEGLQIDEFGNRFIQIGDNPTCIFTCHLDTATGANTTVNHVIEGNIIKTDGKSILGADDKAGVTVMSYMIENKVPGLYYFFLGEEVGCVGSRKLSSSIKDLVDGIEDSPWKKFTKVIAFDRRGYDSVITHQTSSRCCSEEFAQALSDELNKCGPVLDVVSEATEATNWISVSTKANGFKYRPDSTGIYTDSAQFTKIYPECTNISVGYKSEHCFTEQQDIKHLEDLAKACLKVDWENLPIKRDKTKSDYSYSGYSNYGYGGYWESEWDDYYNQPPARKSYATPTPLTDEKLYFFDEDYRYVSMVKIKKASKILLEVDFANERKESEKVMITDLLDTLEVSYNEVTWDGLELIIKHNLPNGHTTLSTRSELAEFLPNLDFWRTEVADDFSSKLDHVY